MQTGGVWKFTSMYLPQHWILHLLLLIKMINNTIHLNKARIHYRKLLLIKLMGNFYNEILLGCKCKNIQPIVLFIYNMHFLYFFILFYCNILVQTSSPLQEP